MSKRKLANVLKISASQKPNSWVSASSTRNWMLRDPLLDWLQMYRTPGYKTPEIIKASTKKKRVKPKGELQLSSKSLGIHDFILEQGNRFEEAVMTTLNEDFPDDIIQISYSQRDIMMETKAVDTFAAMQEGYPMIYQGVLHDKPTHTFGSPDLMVRSDYLECLVDDCPLTEEQWSESAKLLADSTDESGPPYHYVIVDIKYSTLKLRSDGLHLLNSGNLPAYKAQLYIYHRALSRLQGYEPAHAYILGRNWEFTKKNKKTRGTGCFERLGIIDYTDDKYDKAIIKRTNDAVEWIQRLRVEGSEWTINPPSIPELYPNMSNKYDSPWHTVKKDIANDIDEITSVWYCGVKQRKRAHDEGVTKWTDEACTAELMGFKKRKTDDESLRLGDIIDEILDINRQDEDNVRPAHIFNNYRNWQYIDGIPKPIELFVDFETVHSAAAAQASASVDGTVSSIFGRPRSLSNASVANGDMIFIIGCGWLEPGEDDEEDPIWHYESFVAEEMTFAAEKKVLADFYERVQEIVSSEVERRTAVNPGWLSSLKDRLKNIARMFRRGDATLADVEDQQLHVNLYHWGHIEPKTFERACERHPRQSFNSKLINENWVDFYKIMKSEPIVVKGALSFGLKHVVRSMHTNGLIDLQWQTNGCTSGIEAMAQAVQIYRDYAGSRLPIRSSEKMNSIVEYNEIDCRAVYYIIDYLRREHHVEEEDDSEQGPIIMLTGGTSEEEDYY